MNAFVTLRQSIHKNLANLCSILSVLPLFLLLRPDSFQFVPGFIIYNNFMDDLDGILAKKLGIQSKFGAALDNVCDAIAHVLIVWIIATHYSPMVLAFGVFVTISMIIRVVSRLEESTPNGAGTPTNELMRHLLLILLLERFYQLQINPYLVIIFVFHSFSLIIPYKMPHLIRARTKSPTTILGVTILLMLAWQIPYQKLF